MYYDCLSILSNLEYLSEGTGPPKSSSETLSQHPQLAAGTLSGLFFGDYAKLSMPMWHEG